MTMPTFCTRAMCSLICVLICAGTIPLAAQTFTTLVNFDESNGMFPYDPLVQAPDGNFYGTAWSGGSDDFGTIFKITPSGTLTTVYTFCLTDCSDGEGPRAGLTLGRDGNLYGTTFYGGTYDNGTVFKLTLGGVLTTLYSFSGFPDGESPAYALVQGSDGNFYGTTTSGGNRRDCVIGCGTIFRVTPSGSFHTVYTFTESYSSAGLIQASDGNYYGTTAYGGANNEGSVFRLSPAGAYSTLYSFCADGDCGYYPTSLVQAADGNLYGITEFGAGSGCPTSGCGNFYQLTLSGAMTPVLTFDQTNGGNPVGQIIQATDGLFYGVTITGGPNTYCGNGCGTAYSVSSTGSLTTLYSFCSLANCADGYNPIAGMIQGTNGIFYSTVNQGGSNGEGAVYSINTGLRPFVEVSPISGSVGSSVTILGSGLTATTSVTFNGTPATFTVVSASEITTSVPTSATSGRIEVVTAHGTLRSNVNFRIRP